MLSTIVTTFRKLGSDPFQGNCSENPWQIIAYGWELSWSMRIARSEGRSWVLFLERQSFARMCYTVWQLLSPAHRTVSINYSQPVTQAAKSRLGGRRAISRGEKEAESTPISTGHFIISWLSFQNYTSSRYLIISQCACRSLLLLLFRQLDPEVTWRRAMKVLHPYRSYRAQETTRVLWL